MLTDTKLRKTTPGPKAYRVTDGHGLYLLVTPSGGRLWRWKYRFEGREQLMSLGQYPDVPLVRARERHAEGRRLLAEGVDPMAKRRAERGLTLEDMNIQTFEWIAGLWMLHWRAGKSEQHIDATWRRLCKNVFPLLGKRNITEIETPDLVRMVKAIEARGVGDLAKRALETCGQIFRYGIAHGHCKRNPCADIKPADVLRATETVNLARVGAAELPALLRAIEVYQGNVLTRLATKLMALTFVRTSELIGARWEEFDLGPQSYKEISGMTSGDERWNRLPRWEIPKERMKMKTPHIVPLSTQAVEVLKLIKCVTGADLYPEQYPYLFPGKRGKATMSNNTILQALRRMGYAGKQTGHGFRGIASTLLHEQGWPHDHIELQLAHAPRNAVSAAYNHALYLEPRARMMQHWGDYLEGLLRGK